MARKRKPSNPFEGDMMAPMRETVRDTTQLMMGAATLGLGFGALGMIGGLVKKP